MSDEELCRALRLLAFQYNDGAPSQAADRIEELAATNEKLKARLDLSEGALDVASKSWGECQRILEQTEAKLRTAEEIGRAFEEDAGQLREKLEELLVVSKRAVRLSLDHADFKLYAMEPMHQAIAAAELKGEDRG
jgi:hypothetical protein